MYNFIEESQILLSLLLSAVGLLSESLSSSSGFLMYRDKIDWEETILKKIYWKVKDADTYLPKVKKKVGYTHIDYDDIFINIRQIQLREKHKDILYRYLHDGLLRTFRVELCNLCKTANLSKQHIFMDCSKIQGLKLFVKTEIRENFNTILSDENLLMLNVQNEEITITIFRYIYSIYCTYIKSFEKEVNEFDFANNYHIDI